MVSYVRYCTNRGTVPYICTLHFQVKNYHCHCHTQGDALTYYPFELHFLSPSGDASRLPMATEDAKHDDDIRVLVCGFPVSTIAVNKSKRSKARPLTVTRQQQSCKPTSSHSVKYHRPPPPKDLDSLHNPPLERNGSRF